MAQFDFIMIKPSHYDDDGYPIVWWRTILPSNSLAALNGLARDAAERQVLGPDVRFNLVPIDECNQHVVPARIISEIPGKRGAKALIGLVGVQSNQFHHALDLAREFRAAGLPVVIGGFHVSGCLSMLEGDPAGDPGGARHGLLAVRRRGRGGAARRACSSTPGTTSCSRSTII